MGWNPEKDGAIWWSECTVHMADDNEDHQVWLKNLLGWIPDRDEDCDEMTPREDPDDLAPEGPVTRQLWKTKYDARDQAIGEYLP